MNTTSNRSDYDDALNSQLSAINCWRFVVMLLGLLTVVASGPVVIGDLLNAPGSGLDGSIRNVNPNRGAPGYTNNCQNCVIAADRTLGGTPTVAKPSLGPLPRSNLEVRYGGKFTNVSGMMEIGAILRESGNGARGIVGGSHPRGYGHVWNVVNQNGVIRFLDSQGTLLKPGKLGVDNFDDFSNFQFLLTAPGRK